MFLKAGLIQDSKVVRHGWFWLIPVIKLRPDRKRAPKTDGVNQLGKAQTMEDFLLPHTHTQIRPQWMLA